MNKSNKLFFISAGFLFLLDQSTKLAIKGFDIFGIHVTGLKLGDSLNILGTFLQITYIENSGMAFGITFGPGKILLSLFSVVASIALAYYLFKIKNYSNWIKLGVTLIFAGAIGNLIDRVFYGLIFHEGPVFFGRVVDFIQVDIPDINFAGLFYTHWPVFNFADAYVTCGVITLLIFHKKIPQFSELNINIFGTKKELPNQISTNTTGESK